MLTLLVLPVFQAVPACPIPGSALYSGAWAAFSGPNPRDLASQLLLPLRGAQHAHLSLCFPHFTGHELEAEIGTLPKPEAEMAFQPGGLALEPVLLSARFPVSPNTGAEWAVDLAHAGSMEPLCTSHPNSTFNGTVLATLTDTSSGAYTPQTSANTTNQGFFRRAGPLAHH